MQNYLWYELPLDTWLIMGYIDPDRPTENMALSIIACLSAGLGECYELLG